MTFRHCHLLQASLTSGGGIKIHNYIILVACIYILYIHIALIKYEKERKEGV